MKTYRVTASYSVYCYATVEAENPDDAFTRQCKWMVVNSNKKLMQAVVMTGTSAALKKSPLHSASISHDLAFSTCVNTRKEKS